MLPEKDAWSQGQGFLITAIGSTRGGVNSGGAGLGSLPLLTSNSEITSKPVPLQSVQTLAKQQFTSFEVELRPYLALQKTHSSGGGGGAGQRAEGVSEG
jgi:hypothetical protein